MIRILAQMSNGYCGCDETFLISFEDGTKYVVIWETLLASYAYTDGFCGDENLYEEATNEGFDSVEEYLAEQIRENSTFDVISEEEYQERIEDGEEERENWGY